jgi:GPH family glycoside/pentoside/hexuronide:cation symporter
LVGIFVSAALVRRFEKRDISIVGLIIVCLCQFVPAMMSVVGLMPEAPMLYTILAVNGFVTGIATTCVAISFGSMMADSADEHEHLFGVRREALYLAGLTFSWKAALGIGGLIAGISLDLIGFPSDIVEHPEQVISPWTLNALAIIYGPGAALISAISAATLLSYQLSKRELMRIQSELIDRRAKT